MSFQLRKASALSLLTLLLAGTSSLAPAQSAMTPLDQPRPLPGPRPSPQTVKEWQSRKFGMFIHFGLYSELGGMWNGKKIDNGYSEQIEANAPIPGDQYAALASKFNPAKFDPDAIVALAKAAGMKFIVITSKHHDGFNMFATKQSRYNIVDATPYHKDLVKELEEACARGDIRFGVYYSTIDWHQFDTYIEGNSNPISAEHEAFNVAQLKELMSNYGPITEIWFDMGKATPKQSEHFAQTVHTLQPQTMVSGRVFNYQGDFTVMGDNAVPDFTIDEPWQTPASIFPETWGYRSWQKRDDLEGKIHENILRLVTVVSRGGNYILNIGPEGDGSVVPYEADVLRGIGQWLKTNGEAIYGSTASPFRTLDFGFATVGQNKLYLFVKDLPQDGILHLPGLSDAGLEPAYVLGDAKKTAIPVQKEADGVMLSAASLQTASHGFLPVVVLPFKGELHVQAKAIDADQNGAFTLTSKEADHFYNYNGYGYEDPPTLYKLRWNIAAKPGKYYLRIHSPSTDNSASITLFVNGAHRTLHLGQQDEEISIAAKPGSNTVLELTPQAPFYKGTKLPAEISSVELVPETGSHWLSYKPDTSF